MSPCRTSERGFTLIELLVAITILALIATAIYGVVVLGANSAGSGERITEQARRLRIATSIVVRQIRSTVPQRVPIEDEGLQPFFLGEPDRIEFVTSAPQKPDGTGLAVVRYWLENDTLMIGEVPLFTAMTQESDDERGFLDPGLSLPTVLLYDVAELRFGYQRGDGDEGDFEDEWDAAFEDDLPSVVRIEVEPTVEDGPYWYHEIPVMVGAMNEVAGEDDKWSRNKASGNFESNREPEEPEPDEDPDGVGDDLTTDSLP